MENTSCDSKNDVKNINSSKFRKVIILMSLICVCTTAYFITDRVLTHIENSANKINPAPNESTILQESEPVLVNYSDHPITTPVENPVPTPTPTLPPPIHPRDLGEIAGNNGVYHLCCIPGGTDYTGTQRPFESRCIGIEPNWTISEFDLEKEVNCIRENGVRRVQSRFWSQDPLHRLVQEAAGTNCAGPYLQGMLGISSMVSSRYGRSPSLLLPGEELYPVSNWIPRGMKYELYSVEGDTRTRVQILNPPLGNLGNSTHVLSSYLPYWKRRFVRMFREMPRNIHKQSCVEMMRAHEYL